MIKFLLRKRTKKITETENDEVDYKGYLDSIKNTILHYENLEPTLETESLLLKIKNKFYIPTEELKNMEIQDICFYALNSNTFREESKKIKKSNSYLEVLKQITEDETAVYKYSLEASINLICFYGKNISNQGLNNLVYNIVDKCNADIGVYTTLAKTLAELKKLEAIEIVYSAVSFKYGENAAKKLMQVNGLKVDFSKRNKIL